jgi:hypothetical protein
MSWVLFFLLIPFPSSIELARWKEIASSDGVRRYFSALVYEAANINHLRDYSSNMFFSLKWTNDSIDFSRPRIYDTLRQKKWLGATTIARLAYLMGGALKYFACIARIPYELTLRAFIVIRASARRITGQRYLPDFL